MISNVLDYSKWIKALMNSSGPISAAGHIALRTSRTLIPDGENSPYTGTTSYALGWINGVCVLLARLLFVEEIILTSFSQVYRGQECIQHSGRTEAFGTNLVVFPTLKYGIVSFANTAETAGAAEETLMWHLVDEKLGIPEDERFNWTKM